jgi:uncharacterized membrane protein
LAEHLICNQRVFKHATTGEDLAAVPAKSLTPADISMDEAMTVIVSGGATTPGRITLKRNASA